nr:hypothetical protein [Tanacetum cinerariifolium]
TKMSDIGEKISKLGNKSYLKLVKMEILLEPTSNKLLVGDDDRLVGLFRADEEAIKNYATFSDIVSFDAIFRSNKINHHYYFITFASGLLVDEIAEAYIWLLKQFKEAFGKDPEIVITDQDPSMKIEIAECFPNKAPSMYVAHNDEVGHEDKMKELLNQAEINVPTVLKVSSKAVISAMLGVDEPDNVLTGNPNLRKVKGTCYFSRMKPVAEVTIEELAKRRTSSVYGGKERHNKRTCTSEPASKKPKVQATPKEKAAPNQQASQPRRSGLRSSTPK